MLGVRRPQKMIIFQHCSAQNNNFNFNHYYIQTRPPFIVYCKIILIHCRFALCLLCKIFVFKSVCYPVIRINSKISTTPQCAISPQLKIIYVFTSFLHNKFFGTTFELHEIPLRVYGICLICEKRVTSRAFLVSLK